MNTDSSMFLLAAATFFLAIFSLPLLITPMRWARVLRWKIPDDTDLANYLGRSLGALAVPLNIMMYVSARDPWGYRAIFDFMILTAAFLCAVHIYGFIKRVQPFSEHLEIILYAAAVLLTWYFYPQPPV